MCAYDTYGLWVLPPSTVHICFSFFHTQLISSFAAGLNFFLMDLLLEDYALWYSMVGFLGTVVGSTLVAWLFKKYKRYGANI